MKINYRFAIRIASFEKLGFLSMDDSEEEHVYTFRQDHNWVAEQVAQGGHKTDLLARSWAVYNDGRPITIRGEVWHGNVVEAGELASHLSRRKARKELQPA